MSPARHLLSFAGGAYRTARYVAFHTPLRVALFATLALAASWPLLSTAASFNEFRDAQVLAHYETVAREALLRWHQAPLWDPYYCGGMYLLGTPQARFVSPTFLLTLLFGETRAEALTAFLMILLGLEGTFRYARDRGATRFGALVAAPLFALGGIFATSPSLGWIGFLGFELLPWLALGVRRALRRERWAIVLVAVAAAWCIGFGGTYAAPLSALWCAFEAIEFIARRRRFDGKTRAAGVGILAIAVLLAVGLAAVRLWPIAETLTSAQRIIAGTPSNSWLTLIRMFFFPIRPETDDGEFYIGFFVLPAALLGLTHRRSMGLAVVAVVSTWMAAGYAVRPSLFGWLRELPLYETLRYPERFLILLGFAATTLAAIGVSVAEAYVRTGHARRVRPRLAMGVFAVASIALVANVGPLVAQHALHAAGRWLGTLPDSVSGPFHQARASRWALEYYEPFQRGSLSCWEAYPVPQSPRLRGDLKVEERLTDPRAGTLTERFWSPNRIDLDISLQRPTSVAVNQNWNDGWRTNVGEVRSDHGLLTVDLPEGTHSVSLRFEPRSAVGGALATAIALAILAGVAIRARRSPTVTTLREGLVLALLAVTPFVPVAAVILRMPQKSFVEPLVTPDGRPLVAESIDEGAVRLDAKFADGIVLEAATLSDAEPKAGEDLMLELDWRRDSRPDPGLGVFVHIEPSDGSGLSGDHVLLSNLLDLQDAPPDKTLRDVIPLFIPEDGRGKSWKVWVGLWRARRGGSRVPVEDAGHTTVDQNRVQAVSFTAR